MPNTHIVLKSLPAGGRTYKPGEHVDASSWANRQVLEDGQWAYIRRLTAADGAEDDGSDERQAPRSQRGQQRRVGRRRT